MSDKGRELYPEAPFLRAGAKAGTRICGYYTGRLGALTRDFAGGYANTFVRWDGAWEDASVWADSLLVVP